MWTKTMKSIERIKCKRAGVTEILAHSSIGFIELDNHIIYYKSCRSSIENNSKQAHAMDVDGISSDFYGS